MILRLPSLFLLLSLTVIGAAQSMLDAGLQWNVQRGSNFSPDVSTTRYRIGAEVVVDDTAYRRLIASDTEAGDDFAATSILLREDGEGRVYARNTEVDGEGLLYDFGAAVGDTLRMFNPFYTDSACELVVAATGDTVLADGVSRRTYATRDDDRGGALVTVIEGLGSIDEGPFGRVCLTDAGDLLLCASANGEVLLNPRGGACFVSGFAEARAAAPGEVYPTVFADYLVLAFAAAGGQRYDLYDARGVRVRSGVLPQGQHRLGTSDLPAGAYVVLVSLRNGEAVSAQVIKR